MGTSAYHVKVACGGLNGGRVRAGRRCGETAANLLAIPDGAWPVQQRRGETVGNFPSIRNGRWVTLSHESQN